MKIKSGLLLLSAALAGICFLAINLFVLQSAYSQYTNSPPSTSLTSETCSANGLVAHWKFDEVVDGSTPDSSGHHFIGKYKYWFRDQTRLLFGTPQVIQGMDGNGLEFKGRQWISAGNHGCFTTEIFTISVWVWQDRDDVVVPTIMSKSAWPSYDGWWLCSTTPGLRNIDVGIAWGNGHTHIKSGYQLPLREWHHIAVSMDNIKHEARFHIDGKPYGKIHKKVPSWLVNWNHDLFLGEYDGSGRWPWYGKLDDVRFYNKVLSDQDIKTIFLSRNNGKNL